MSRMSLPRGVLPLAIVAVGLIGAVAMIALRPSPPKRPASPVLPVVEIFTVTDETPRVVVTGYGNVAARERISIVPQVSGVVLGKSPALASGGSFAAGDTLLRIDTADYELAVEMAAAQVARGEYEMARAEQEAEIALREWIQVKEGAAKPLPEPNSLVRHEPQLHLARADLASAGAGLAKARLDLERCTITAPFAGRVVQESVDVGQYVRAGSELASIYAAETAEVTVPLSDADLAFFDLPGDGPGARVEISTDFAGSERRWSGRIVRVGGVLDERSRMVDVIIAVDGEGEAAAGARLLDGMFVSAAIEGRTVPGARGIPRSGLRPDGTVWTVDDQDLLRIQAVDIVRMDREEALILSDIEPGERVVVSQLDVVTEGMKVRVAGGGNQ